MRQLLTESRAACARRCPLEHELRYSVGIVPLTALAETLRVGTLGHHGLEAWWSVRHGRLEAALDALERHATPASNRFERAALRELVTGYHYRWCDEPYETIAVEKEFRMPMVHPDTGAVSDEWDLGGKLDVIARDRRTGRVVIIDHKFSGEDIAPGSEFWARLRVGGQSSQYIRGAASLGYEVDGMIYDVLAKPRLRPLRATPESSRRYTKAGKLDARQRLNDETPDEYACRVREDIASNPDKYYQRGTVVRLQSQQRMHDLDSWHLAEELTERPYARRNTDACFRYGHACDYLPVCCGEASLDDPTRYTRTSNMHPELQEVTE